jgi:hypothetical protein
MTCRTWTLLVHGVLREWVSMSAGAGRTVPAPA